MNQFKGTQGEWTATRSLNNERWQIEGDNLVLVQHTFDGDHAEANAHLISAAPELLEFAMEMVERYPNSPWIYEQANKAISKALGQ